MITNFLMTSRTSPRQGAVTFISMLDLPWTATDRDESRRIDRRGADRDARVDIGFRADRDAATHLDVVGNAGRRGAARLRSRGWLDFGNRVADRDFRRDRRLIADLDTLRDSDGFLGTCGLGNGRSHFWLGDRGRNLSGGRRDRSRHGRTGFLGVQVIHQVIDDADECTLVYLAELRSLGNLVRCRLDFV